MGEIKLICGDAKEELKKMESEISLTITSPPYNMGGKSLGYQPRSKISDKHYDVYNDDKDEESYKNFILEVLNLCIEKSKYVFWNMQYVISTKNTIIEIQNKFRDNLKEIFIWNKQAIAQIMNKKTNQPVRMASGFEFVFIFGKDGTRNFKDVNFPKNRYVPNIKTWHKKEFFTEHHATFPRELPSYFIEYFSFKGDTILDPFCGTGTVGVVAKAKGRNFIGIDISPKYIEIAQKRIDNTMEEFLI